MTNLADLRTLLEQSPGCVVLVLITRPSNQDQIGLVQTRAENTIANLNPAGWRCVTFAAVPEEPPPGDALDDLFKLLHTEDPEVDGVLLSVGEGLNRPAKYYSLKEIDSGLELVKAFSTKAVG
jgi:hypothetical protein